MNNKRELGLSMMLVIIIALAFSVSIPLVNQIGFAENDDQKTVDIEVSVDDSSVQVGQTFTYTIQYAYSSNSTNFDETEKIVVALDDDMSYVDAELSADVEAVTESDGIVTFDMVDEIQSGTTGYVTLSAKYPAGSLYNELEDETIDVSIETDAANVTITNTVTIDVYIDDDFTWDITKSVTDPVYSSGIDPLVGSTVTYQITLSGNDAVGGFNIQDVTVTDTLPDGAAYVSSSPEADVDGQELTWEYDELKAGSSKTIEVVVEYPESDDVYVGATVTNEVEAIGYDDEDHSDSDKIYDSVGLSFGDEEPKLTGVTKKSRVYDANSESSADEYSKDQTIEYYISGIGNGGNVPLDTITIYDSIPEGIIVSKADTKGGDLAYVTSGALTYGGDIKTSELGWIDWDGSDDIGTDVITGLKWVFTDVAVAESISTINVEASFNDSLSVDEDIAYENTVLVDAYAKDYNDEGDDFDTDADGDTLEDVANVKLVDELPWLSIDKSVSSFSAYEGDTVEYSIIVTNNTYATGDFEDDDRIVITDIFPEYDSDNDGSVDTYVFENFNLTSPASLTYDVTEESDGKVSEAVFTIEDITLKPGESYEITYTVDVVDGVMVGSYENEVSASLTDDDDNGKVGNREHDLDDSESLYVEFQGSLKSIKGIGYNIYGDDGHSIDNLLLTDDDGNVIVEDADGTILTEDTDLTDDDEEDFYRVTTGTGKFSMPQGIAIVNATLEGGNIRYRLEVSNDDSNGPISNIVIIDRLPVIGDTGAIVSSERESDWSPYLISEVSEDDDVTVYYTTEDLSYSENKTLLKATEDMAIDSDTWTSDLSSLNITEVTHIMFVYDDDVVLYPGDESIAVEWNMRVPVGTPTLNDDNSNAIAWNSFGYGATYKIIDDDGDEDWEAFLPAEPIMVGIRVEDEDSVDESAALGKIGDYIWEDLDKDGIQDSGETGINNIKVNLYMDEDGDGGVDIDRANPYDTTYTSDDYSGNAGYYLFPNLSLGEYTVEFEMPDDYYLTELDVDSNISDERDSDFTSVVEDGIAYYQTSDIIILDSNEEDLTIDAGIYQKASVGNFVWNDSDADGKQDSGETGVEAITVNLYSYTSSSDKWEIQRYTTTDSNGEYEFTDLDPGTYYLEFADIPNEYELSEKDSSSASDSTDSDVDADSLITDSFTLISNEEDMTWDMGIHKAILGDYVWYDPDRDGVQDSSEDGIKGVDVYLYYTSYLDTIIGTETTDSSGGYLFTDLDSGDYTVKFEIPSGYSPTNNDQSSDDTIDSDGVLDDSLMVTGSYTLDVGEIDLTVDMGYYIPGEIGNLVFHDKNYNGIQDSGEEGIEGAILYLVNEDGNEVDVAALDIDTDNPTTTDTNGEYYFDDLYLTTASAVKIELPDGYDGFTLTNQGSLDDVDSDGVYNDYTDASALSHTVTLTKNDNTDYTIDFGVFQYATLGNRVWYDDNADGIQDSDEGGVSDITVILYQDDEAVETTTTDGSGYYEFDELTPGDYSVEFTLPDDYSITTADSGSDDGVDSDAVSKDNEAIHSIAVIEDITLESGEVNYTYDVGIYNSFSLGDYVWIDKNGDGLQDSDEVGINDVTLELYVVGEDAAIDSIVSKTNDGSDGYYIFDDLPMGEYYIEATLPEDYYLTDLDSGSDDSLDSDLYSSGSDTIIYKTKTYKLDDATIVVDGEITEPTVDIGLYEKTASLGNRVWLDDNYNGTQDTDEEDVQGIKIQLYRNDDTDAVATTYTDEYGAYQFTNLAPGSYDLTFKLPDDYNVTRIVSGDDETNSDAVLSSDEAYGEINDYVLYIDDDITSLDVGLFQYASLGDYYWYDENADGVQDSGEGYVEGKTVTLSYYDDVTSILYEKYSSTTTIAGEYLFEDLYPGTYSVTFEEITDYYFTAVDSGEDDEIDSDVDDLGEISNIELSSSDDNRTNDAGIYKFAKLGDFVWLDENRNGTQDDGEVGIEGIEVNLYQDGELLSKDSLDNPTYTDENGYYEFDDLVPGDYSLAFIVPDDYSITVLDNTSDDLDSDGESEDDEIFDEIAVIEEINLTSGEEDMTYDLGLYESFSLGDYIWIDNDGDGIQDSDEEGINDIEVNLYMLDTDTDEYSKIDTTVTAENTATGNDGYYEFTDLPMGEYYIEVIKTVIYEFTDFSSGSDTSIDSNIDLDSYDGESRTPSIIFDEDTTVAEDGALTDPSIDIGLVKIAGLGDRVFVDTNYNGIQDDDEVGLKDVEVRLYKDGVLVDEDDLENPTYTDEDGYYYFLDIDPDVYSLEFDLPDDYNLTHQNIGDDDELDSDGVLNSSDSSIVEINDYQLYMDEMITSLDIGVYQYTSLGDYYWYDTNMDGLQDDDEDTISGQTVTLTYDEITIDTNTLVYTEGSKTTTTDSNGYYLFDDLNPGTYAVEFELVENYVFTLTDEGYDDTIDSDVDDTGYVGDITLEQGEHIRTIDAGIYEYASLGDVVWYDENRDGIQNDAEDIEDIVVILYQDDVEVERTTTDTDGSYFFDELIPGEYSLEFILPENYSITTVDNTTDDSDSDGTSKENQVLDESAIIDDISLDPGENDMSFDLGLYKSFSLGDYVWLDTDGDGLQDSDEEGVNAVEINLYMMDEDSLLYEEIDSVLTYTNEDFNTDGYYEFTDLPMGEYYIEAIKPGNHYFTLTTTGDDTTVDSNIDLETYPDKSRTQSIVFDEDTDIVEADELTDSSIDIGLIKTAGLGDRVWIDANYNGIQDDDEEGLEDVEVRLYENGELVSEEGLENPTYTDENGYYAFSDIDPSIYSLEVDLPDDYYLTHQNIGEDDEVDSDGALSSEDDGIVEINDYQLYVDEAITSLDVGVYQYASLGDYYWYDKDEDGIQDDGELPVVDQTVTLTYESVTVNTESNTLIYTETSSQTVTDSEGYYLFDNLYPGTYEIVFDVEYNYEFTKDNKDEDDTVDSDVDDDGYVGNIVLTSGTNNMTIDVGIHEEEDDDDDSSSSYSSSGGSSSSEETEETTEEDTNEEDVEETTEEVEETVEETTSDDEEESSAENSDDEEETTESDDTSEIIPDNLIPEIVEVIDREDEDDEDETEPDQPTNTRIFRTKKDVDEIEIAAEPEHGTVEIDEDNNIIYIPDDTFEGEDTVVVVIEEDGEEFIMEIDIFDEDIAQGILTELPKTGGIPLSVFLGFGFLSIIVGIIIKKS